MSTQTTCSYIYLLRVSLTLLLQTVPVYVNTNYLLLYIPTSHNLHSTPTNSPCICQHKLLAPIYVNTNYLLLYIPTSCILNSTPTNSPCICQHKLLAPYIYLLRVSLTLLLQTVPVYVNTNYIAPIYTYFVYP